MVHTFKRACIVLAIGTISGSAFAQSSSTIYGLVDAYLAYGEGGGKTYTGMNGLGGLAGDRLGFRGSEDLGGGIKAIYDIEYGFELDSNTGFSYTRQSWVGLEQREMGSLTFGYQYAPGYLIPGNYQVMLGSAGFAPRSVLSMAGGYTITPRTPARFPNSVRYASPDMGGLNVQGIWSFGTLETDSDTMAKSDDDRWGLGAEYQFGAARVGAIYHQVGVGSGVSDTKEYFLGGSYDFGFLKLVGTWSRKDADGATSADNNLMSAGVIVPVGTAGSAHFGYGRLNPRGSNNDADTITVGYIHELSKRTKLYAAYNRLHYASDAPGTFAVTVAEAGATSNSVVAGMFFSF